MTEAMNQTRRILVLSAVYPTKDSPLRGVFVRERVTAVAKLPGYSVRVVAPLPHFPGSRWITRWPNAAVAPREDEMDGIPVYRPRFFYPPKIGANYQSRFMWSSVARTVDRLRDEFDFDLIDAHFAYPAGVLATQLGLRYCKPVVITGRGEDMLRFPGLPVLGDTIRRAMATQPHAVALSDEIGRAFINCGVNPDRVALIPNGVDGQKFRRLPVADARRELQLPLDAKIIVSVGDYQERKGFHILVEALARIRDTHPNLMLVVVGGPAPYGADYSPAIKQKIAEFNLQDRVRLVGKVPHDRLSWWYSSADVFALLSSREGCCNVVLEALSCGAPAVITAAGDIPAEVQSGTCGLVVPERTAEAAANQLRIALARAWNRESIQHAMTRRSWASVAQQVDTVFTRAIAEFDGHESAPDHPRAFICNS